MIYLIVSYEQKDIAKGLGAKWDPAKKLWYAPDDSYKALLEQFGSKDKSISAKPKITINKQLNYIKLIGENEDFRKGELYIDIIPKSSNFSLKKNLNKDDYYRIKDTLAKRNAYKCEICEKQCNTAGEYIYLCERFSYSLETKIQKLEKISTLCNQCFTTTRLLDKQIALETLVNLLDISKEEAKEIIFDSFNIWKERSKYIWNLDTSILSNSGLHINNNSDVNQTNVNQTNVKKITINKDSKINRNEIKNMSISKKSKTIDSDEDSYNNDDECYF